MTLNTALANRVAVAGMVLSPLFLAPPTKHLRTSLQDPGMLAAWPLSDDVSAQAAASLRGGTDDQAALDRDHLYLFTGVSAPLAQPYESPYHSPDGLVYDTRAAQVREHYRALGFAAPDARMPDDHIGLEIAFIAEMCTLISAGADHRNRLRAFLDEHLTSFSGGVLTGVRTHARTRIYQALPGLTEGFIASARQVAGQ